MKYIRVYDTRGKATSNYERLMIPVILISSAMLIFLLTPFNRGPQLPLITGYLNKGCTWTVHGSFPRKQDGLMLRRWCHQNLGHQKPISADPLFLHRTQDGTPVFNTRPDIIQPTEVRTFGFSHQGGNLPQSLGYSGGNRQSTQKSLQDG